MAFSTQKDFFDVPFMNHNVEYECKKACVKLKSYESTIDDRSWAIDESKQSRFLSDLVTCQTRVKMTEDTDPRGIHGDSLLVNNNFNPVDSLLECANLNLAKYQELMLQNQLLQKDLEMSKDNLETATEENKKIKNIINSKFETIAIKEIEEKVKKLSAIGKISKTDENDFLNIFNKIDNIQMAHELLKAENWQLKSIIEKLSRRSNIENIDIENETGTDIPNLQNQVNKLRKELKLLRQMEVCKIKEDLKSGCENISERDAELLKEIIKERNALRQKCKTLKQLETKVEELQNKSNNLENQTKFVSGMEQELKGMQGYYEDQLQKANDSVAQYKTQLEELRKNLLSCMSEAQKNDLLIKEIACLKNEITKRDAALCDYDCQFQQLMSVIEELKSNNIQGLSDNETQTCDDYIEDLGFFASATINEIMKKLGNRNSQVQYSGIKGSDKILKIANGGDNTINDNMMLQFGMPPEGSNLAGARSDDCCAQLKQLQETVKELEDKLFDKAATDCEALCADALTKLKDLRVEHENLKKENDGLQQTLLKHMDNIDVLSVAMVRLDKDMDKNMAETSKMDRELRETLNLVKDISDIQLKNQQLAGAVNVINSRDDQKMIDDLRSQLLAERNKNAKCEDNFANIRNELQKAQDKIQKLDRKKDDIQDDGNDYTNKTDGEKGTSFKSNNEKYDNFVPGKTTDGEKGTSFKSNNEKFDNFVPGKTTDEKKRNETNTQDEILNRGQRNSDGNNQLAQRLQRRNTQDRIYTDGAATGENNVQNTMEDEKNPKDMEEKKPRHENFPENIHEKNTENIYEKNPEDRQRVDGQDAVGNDQYYLDGRNLEGGIGGGKNTIPEEYIGGDPTESKSGNYVDGYRTIRTIGKSGADVSNSGRVGLTATSEKNRLFGQLKGAKDKSVEDNDKNLNEFLAQSANNMKFNIRKGSTLEKELRDILDTFIRECGFCLCKSNSPKTKFQLLCHKLYCQGIERLLFKELSYLFKRIYNAAEKLKPGGIFKMILSIQGQDQLKCCSCKNALCCNNSEEFLKDRVNILQKQIESAHEYFLTVASPKLVPNPDQCDSRKHRSDRIRKRSTSRTCSALHRKMEDIDMTA